MKKNKRVIKYKKERVILSDVLPYEIPVTYSNRHFYDFLTKNKIELKNHTINWEVSDPTLNEIIRLIFDIPGPIISNHSILDKGKGLKTIPFNYKISHKQNDFRQLTVIHPKNQLALVEFYENNKQLILHHCKLSPFSIRRAEKIAKFIFHKDKTHKENLAENSDGILEEENKEYESLKTFFVYKNYSNIHKFYESYKYHRCEKKYNKLLKFDISKCFDSIYSHSISWALFNKEIIKENIPLSKGTFGGKFDSLMQDLNFGETNGIIIGPEFSRLFAEVILQKIDRNIEFILRDQENLKHKVDYEIFRYVDDFFVFYNDERTKDLILKNFRLQLREYKLYLNDEKTVIYEKPIITEITIAKQKITDLLNKHLAYKIEDNKSELENEKDLESENEKFGSIYVSSNRLITKFKTIIKETSIEYKDVLNYSLTLIERKFKKIIKNYQEFTLDNKSEKAFTKACLEILDFTFFLYSVSPRVNTTIKLCRILRRLTEFLNSNNLINIDFKHLVFKKIYDNLYFIIQKNKSVEHAQVETLYLLIAMGELGKEYWLDSEALRQYMCIEKNDAGDLYFNGSLNYFSIVVLLFYMKNKVRYFTLRNFLLVHIKKRFNEAGEKNRGKSAELIFLLFDLLTCPYLDLDFKKEILSLHAVIDVNLQLKIINYRKCWFTKWADFDFGRELDAKHSQEVY